MLSILDRLLSLAEKVIRVISLKNVIIWFLTALFIIVGYTIFENRDAILKTVVNKPNIIRQSNSFRVSAAVKERARQFVEREDLVVGMTILTADIRYNRRYPVYWYSDDAFIMKRFDELFNGRYGGVPLFTSDDRNNASVVSVINAEFTCGTFDESGISFIFPGLSSRLLYVCKTSVPPFYGQFAGYIVIALNRRPNDIEVDLIKAEIIDLSNEIYFRDISTRKRG